MTTVKKSTKAQDEAATLTDSIDQNHEQGERKDPRLRHQILDAPAH